jgi:hypothetical protein
MIDPELVASYHRVLALGAHSAFSWKGRWGWTSRPRPFGDIALRNALAGRYALSTSGSECVSYVVLDFDWGHASHSDIFGELADDDLAWASQNDGSAWLSWSRPGGDDLIDTTPTPPKLLRRYVAKRLRPALDRLRAAWPDIEFVPCKSPRGAHVLVLLKRPAGPDDARAFALGLITRAGLDCERRLEVFPQIGVDGSARMPTLPVTGRSRILADDCETPRFHRRADDIAYLLSCKRAHIPGTTDQVPSVAAPLRSTAARVPPVDSSSDLRKMGQAHGADFGKQISILLTEGIPDQASTFDCLRKITASLYPLLRDEKATIAAVTRWLALPGVSERAKRHTGGVRKLVADAKSYVRYLSRAKEQRPFKNAQIIALLQSVAPEIQPAQQAPRKQRLADTLEGRLLKIEKCRAAAQARHLPRHEKAPCKTSTTKSILRPTRNSMKSSALSQLAALFLSAHQPKSSLLEDSPKPSPSPPSKWPRALPTIGHVAA